MCVAISMSGTPYRGELFDFSFHFGPNSVSQPFSATRSRPRLRLRRSLSCQPSLSIELIWAPNFQIRSLYACLMLYRPRPGGPRIILLRSLSKTSKRASAGRPDRWRFVASPHTELDQRTRKQQTFFGSIFIQFWGFFFGSLLTWIVAER